MKRQTFGYTLRHTGLVHTAIEGTLVGKILEKDKNESTLNRLLWMRNVENTQRLTEDRRHLWVASNQSTDDDERRRYLGSKITADMKTRKAKVTFTK